MKLSFIIVAHNVKQYVAIALNLYKALLAISVLLFVTLKLLLLTVLLLMAPQQKHGMRLLAPSSMLILTMAGQ